MLNWIRSSVLPKRLGIEEQSRTSNDAEVPAPSGAVLASTLPTYVDQSAASALFIVGGSSAHRGAVRNRQARWEDIVNEANPDRVGGPFFRPALQPKFTFDPAASVFTIGSCFAEHVQYALTQQGLSLTSLLTDVSDAENSEWFIPEGYRESRLVYPTGFFHRFNLPSMEQEIAHLVGRDHRLCGEALVMRDGAVFRDLHYHPDYAVQSVDTAVARRAYVRRRFAHLGRTDVFIMTLGVTEAWYDLESSLYLNLGPSLPIIRSNPERYELRVLDWHVLMACARRVVTMLTQVAPALKIIVTVSPIPLDTTFRPSNVAVATMQSKSTLVAVATQLAAENPAVDYFPSYEIAMLSERSSVWQSDQRHVQTDFVANVISWFVNNYCRASV